MMIIEQNVQTMYCTISVKAIGDTILREYVTFKDKTAFLEHNSNNWTEFLIPSRTGKSL